MRYGWICRWTVARRRWYNGICVGSQLEGFPPFRALCGAVCVRSFCELRVLVWNHFARRRICLIPSKQRARQRPSFVALATLKSISTLAQLSYAALIVRVTKTRRTPN
jgi:hypothetical protein